MAIEASNCIEQTNIILINKPAIVSIVGLYFNRNTHDLLGNIYNNKSVKSVPANQLGEYKYESVQKTLDNKYVPQLILEARKIQDEILAINFKGQKIKIADIGCGDGYHGAIFAPDCEAYHGFDISKEMVKKTGYRWAESGLKNAHVVECDAAKVELEPNFYDVAWSLYFTSGNFRDEFDDIDKYDDAYLDKNPKFISIISNFYNALKQGGKLFLTVYKDNPETEAAQRQFYQDTGQSVITPLGSRFVATKENFWSVRWTKESMFLNLAECGINPEQVKFNDLNNVGWLVEIAK